MRGSKSEELYKGVKKRRAFLVLAGVLLGLGGSGVWFLNRSKPFNKEVWIRSRPTHFFSSRYMMADDLVKNHLPRGMRLGEILALIGQPDLIFALEGSHGYRESFRATTNTDRVLVYRLQLGIAPGSGIASLRILIGVSDELKEAVIYETD